MPINIKVVYGMSGTAQSAGDVLAGVSSLDVVFDVRLPQHKVIDLEADSVGGVSHEEDFGAIHIYQTAEFKNIQHAIHSSSGLHAKVPAGTVLEAIQKFHAPQKVSLTRLRLQGSADEKARAAKCGIGVLINGVDLMVRKMSGGSSSGEKISPQHVNIPRISCFQIGLRQPSHCQLYPI